MKSKATQDDYKIVFINYRRTDAAWPAEFLAEKLGSYFGESRIFLDERDILPGDDFPIILKRHLERATVLIAIIGKNWLQAADTFGRRLIDDKDDWVYREIRSGLEKKDCRVIPVLIDDAELPKRKNALPSEISALLDKNQIRIRQTNSIDDIKPLIRAIERSGFIQKKNGAVALIKPRESVANEIRSHIERGKVLLNSLRRSLPKSRTQLDDQSKVWHDWRVYSEQIMRQSFSTLEPLEWLKAIKPRQFDFNSSWKVRAKNLPQDTQRDLDYLENLLVRLDNYKELI